MAWTFYNSNGEAMIIDGGVSASAASITNDLTLTGGNLVIATADKGIDFSEQSSPAAGMTSELLDHYEEGTWTPVLWDTSLSSGESQGYAAATNGRYTRIGDICHIQGKLWMSSLGTLTTTAGVAIGGLPFVTRNEANTESTFNFGYMAQGNLGGLGNSPVGYASANVSYFYVMIFGDDATQTVSMPISEWSADGFATFGGLYKVKE